MIETPSTCFLQYPKVPINCNSFLDWSICIYSIAFKVSGGTTALPAIQVPKCYFFTWSLAFFQVEFQFLLHTMLPIQLVLLPPPLHGNLLQLDVIHTLVQFHIW